MGLLPQLAVLVVSYNTKELLLDCVHSIFESIAGIAMEVVVVDNASRDGSLEALRKAFPSVTTISNSRNRGFAAACNQAVVVTNSPFLLLLNSDACLTPGAFKALWECMHRLPRCAAAGCRMVNAAGDAVTNTRNFLNAFNQVLEPLGRTLRFNSRHFWRTYRPSFHGGRFDCSVDWIDASCLMVRRTALNQVGLFDEQFFMYSEDEDLCFRLREGGWCVCFSAEGSALHHGGKSAEQDRFNMLVQYYSSQMLFLLKHGSRTSLFAYSAMMKSALMAKGTFHQLSSRADQARKFNAHLSALRIAYASLLGRDRRARHSPQS
jgi:N-acetylglucosaminyl-diphospho-decaprenol L-rhamnosyltransferase